MTNLIIYIILTIVVFIVFKFFLKEKKEESTLPQSKTIYLKTTCKDCKIWNNMDAKTKCDAACMKEYPDKYIRATGKWKNTDGNIECGCKYLGKLQKLYVGCPIVENKEVNTCFISNHQEAQEKCPKMCNKYLPNTFSVWTGNWKDTSDQTSACECHSYQNKLNI